ncbi:MULTISPECIES: N-acetylglutaminylglutamine amidotransferase [Thiorhodovibrio]|uniref:N-acetylglutaminylglutamine amidotransferase n=1 Tax=Thiorhodovibrio TaxID=61593 RepID=UPI001914BA38|nr:MULTISPECIES: N-acetylglutaminylglutamine amidotransferase [Thiorhodovibrio]MBK5967956.1 asparagine synthase (glutamine-hydrolyzing) [Thiorhodovibrio winogradskyi]WPL11770.1 Asparagine synthetase [glutamine-hydrolyzing] 1 [Thiorhodovibrio litoralis]
MCGLCGEIRFDDKPIDLAALAAINDTMAPRGPDGRGLFQQGALALGHRRLSIIDLSTHAAQPMVDNTLGLSVAFNGCIYNYQSLREELIGKGYQFFSHGDTEVVLKAFHAWGERCVERFHGMFAFAVAERDSGRLTLVRDRLGIKPLYLAEVPGGLRFASSLPALLAGGGIDTDLDPVALHYYMHFHSVVPAPYTILRGVRKLPPASIRVIEADGRSREHCYWEPQFEAQAGDAGRSEQDWHALVLESLRTAVDRRLVADVDVGVLLSGGLDSSLIVGLLAEQGQTGLNTFSVGFESVGSEVGDEFQYSDIIASHYGTKHHKIQVDSKAKLLPNLPGCVRAMAEPMVSHDVIGFYLLSQEVAKHVKVVQSGQGADEVFGGYHWYPPMVGSTDPLTDYARAFCDREQAEFCQAVHPRFHGEDYSRDFIRAHFAHPGADAPVDKALRIDQTIMLVDDPVKRVDNMTMAWGLEARVPFLDHELVELAARVPDGLKLADEGKGILKAIGRKVIPSEVIDRPKGYFPVPALKYLRGDVLDMVRGVVTSKRAQERELFQAGYVENLLAAPEDHITPLRGSKLWQVALLNLWLDEHGL